MISVVIPVFNQDVTKLAGDLSVQLAALNIGGEILVMDDGSANSWKILNRPVSQLPLVKYRENGINQGRIKIRQMLAATARHDLLLFLDGDSALLSPHFLQTYYQHLPATPAVIVGGRRYTPAAPTDCAYYLHWKYGTEREARPGAAFMSNNFMVHKGTFNKLEFTGNWNGYGHEDTWIGIQLERLQIPVLLIDNKVLHEGLEATPVFLEKAERALGNLLQLQSLVPIAVLAKHVRLYNYYATLKLLRLLWLPRLIKKIHPEKSLFVYPFVIPLRSLPVSLIHTTQPQITDISRLAFLSIL